MGEKNHDTEMHPRSGQWAHNPVGVSTSKSLTYMSAHGYRHQPYAMTPYDQIKTHRGEQKKLDALGASATFGLHASKRRGHL